MSPDVDFTLTEDNCKSYEQSLAGQGIKVCPKSRETAEDLEKGGISYVSTGGILVFREREYIYHIFQNAKGHRLTVDAFTHDLEAGEALVAAIKCVYPQREHKLPDRPIPTRKLDKSRIVNAAGCIVMLLLFGAMCFFAAYGIWNFFK